MVDDRFYNIIIQCKDRRKEMEKKKSKRNRGNGMRRITLMVLKMFFTAPYYIFRIWLTGRKKTETFDKGFQRCKLATRKANKAGRVRIEYSGLENIPEKSGYIYYPNHQGLFDMLVFLEVCPETFAFVMKKEVRNKPIVKSVAKATGSLTIDRDDLRQSMEVINTMIKEVKKGRNFIIFPEGTRNKNKNIPGEFKAGSFKAALKSKSPIIPCALYNSYIPFDEKHIRPTTVKLAIMKPMYYKEYQGMTTVAIAEEVKKRIVEKIKEFDKEEELLKN